MSFNGVDYLTANPNHIENINDLPYIAYEAIAPTYTQDAQ